MEIQSLLRQTELLLSWLGKQPTVVTVSRSSEDDYCPPDQVLTECGVAQQVTPVQVEEIQEGLLGLLHTKYRGLTIVKGYLGEEGLH